jgi:Uma2 family endonuclease
VADTSLAHDRERKGSLYARAGILDYWIVNLVNRCLEVYRDPEPSPDTPYGWRYRSVERYVTGQSVSPLAFAGVRILVADLLP